VAAEERVHDRGRAEGERHPPHRHPVPLGGEQPEALHVADREREHGERGAEGEHGVRGEGHVRDRREGRDERGVHRAEPSADRRGDAAREGGERDRRGAPDADRPGGQVAREGRARHREVGARGRDRAGDVLEHAAGEHGEDDRDGDQPHDPLARAGEGQDEHEGAGDEVRPDQLGKGEPLSERGQVDQPEHAPGDPERLAVEQAERDRGQRPGGPDHQHPPGRLGVAQPQLTPGGGLQRDHHEDVEQEGRDTRRDGGPAVWARRSRHAGSTAGRGNRPVGRR
jgi:hypothetical protein